MDLLPDIFITYPAKVKYKTYQTRWQIGDISVSGNAQQTENNPLGLGCYLVMSGRGCDDIFRILDSRGLTFGDMFERCVHWFDTDFHFTRLDIAIDDRNEVPFFTPVQIRKKCEKDKEVSMKYNKPIEEIGSWKRTEMQLRDEKAQVFETAYLTTTKFSYRNTAMAQGRWRIVGG